MNRLLVKLSAAVGWKKIATTKYKKRVMTCSPVPVTYLAAWSVTVGCGKVGGVTGASTPGGENGDGSGAGGVVARAAGVAAASAALEPVANRPLLTFLLHCAGASWFFR